ncbi:MAG: succinate dehydrogenase, cytochrome b556 subunit [Pseudomonadota bacterium]
MGLAPARGHPLWYAYLLHRLSGLGLALFLPVHFWVLSLALTDAAALDAALHWAERPLVKAAEVGLVFLLAVHFFGGLRLLALEFLPWSPRQKTYAAGAAAGAAFVSLAFLMQAMG